MYIQFHKAHVFRLSPTWRDSAYLHWYVLQSHCLHNRNIRLCQKTHTHTHTNIYIYIYIYIYIVLSVVYSWLEYFEKAFEMLKEFLRRYPLFWFRLIREFFRNIFEEFRIWVVNGEKKEKNVYISKVKLATVVEGDKKAPFSVATTPRWRGGCYSLPWIASLYL